MIQTVKLAKLRLSPINVRTADAAALALEPLAADIAARGVLQNLLVTPASKPRGMFEVFDGGRRLRALQLLAEAGSIDAEEFEVPVRVLKADDATISETSLAANFHQLRLNPAEECKAFQHFLGADGDIDAVAKRFGQTRRFIEGRLRLASLAAPIFDALATGEITLDVAKAYATTDSEARQLSVWESYRHSNTVADTIRRVIAQNSMDANCAIARLVGEDAYVAAGGAVDRDLFADDADKWTNPEIAEGLADTILKTEADRLVAELGLGWVRPIRTPYAISHAHNLYHVSLERPPLDEPTADRLAQLREREAELSSAIQHNGFSDAQIEVFITEINQVSDQIDTIENRAPVLPEGLRPHVGAFLTLTPQGEMQLDARYFSEMPITRVDDHGDTLDAPNDDHSGGRDTLRDTAEAGNAGDAGGGARENIVDGFRIGDVETDDVGAGSKPISARLADELAMQRRDVLGASILGHPELALDYLLFAMIDPTFVDGSRDTGTTIRAPFPSEPVTGDLPASPARDTLAEARAALNADWTAHATLFDRFIAFRALDDGDKTAWMTWIVAATLETRPVHLRDTPSLHDGLAAIMGVDVAAMWRPTAANFFDRISKSTMVTILNDVGGPAVAQRHATLKKPEMAAASEKLFAGRTIVEPEVKAAALEWLPEPMRFATIDLSSIMPIAEMDAEDPADETDSLDPDDAADDDYNDIDDDDTLKGAAYDEIADQLAG